MTMTDNGPSLDDLARLLGCAPSEVAMRVAEMEDAAPKPPLRTRPNPVHWARKGSNSQAKIDGTRIRTHERRVKVWDLRKQFWTIDAISKAVGVSTWSVRQDLKWYLEQTLPPDIEDRRTLELERIDAMSRRVEEALYDANGAIDFDAVREWRGLRKLAGDMAGLSKVAPQITVNVTPEALMSLIEGVAGVSEPVRVLDDPAIIDVESTEAGDDTMGLGALVEAIAS